MARAGAVYPQVEVGAAALADSRVAACAPRESAARALAMCRRSGARALALGARRVVREADLARVVGWGLGHVPVADVAWTALPVVRPAAAEIEVRRRFPGGSPMVLVSPGRGVSGVIDRERAGVSGPVTSLGARLEHRESREGEAQMWLLRVAGKVGEGMGAPAFAVGGVVRDLLLGRAVLDLDVVVEGDGIAFARRLAEEVGGRVSLHAAFGTASIDGASAPGGAPLRRVDVASARTERYERPGALPVVRPARLGEDLERRDFSINAMAMALAPSAFGQLMDPRGGRGDLARRLLRPLHPLSFVEDPTRIFRAARYGARLGFRLAPEGRAALRLALRAGRHEALSGQRLRAELDLLAAEPRGVVAFDRLLRWGVARLWHRNFRSDPGIIRRLRATARLRKLLSDAGLALDPWEIALLALLMGQRPGVVAGTLNRLAITGAPRSALSTALATGGLATRLEREARRSAVARLLDRRPPAVLASAWLGARGPARRRIEWYLSEGRLVRPCLSGADLIALGVPRGPAVGAGLAMLRRLRLAGTIETVAEERQRVKRWTERPNANPSAIRPGRVKGGVK